MPFSLFPLVILVGGFVVLVYVSKAIRIVQQAQTMIIERLGKYHRTLNSGLNFINPLLDRPRDLLGHELVVDRLFDVAEDADRRDAELLQHQSAEREGEAGLGWRQVVLDLGDHNEETAATASAMQGVL